jgi:hypothetical protein
MTRLTMAVVRQNERAAAATSPVVQNLEARSMQELVEAIRVWRDMRGISLATLDHIAGWADGYGAKLEAFTKNLGWQSLSLGLNALAIKLVVVEDPEQRKLVERRWVRRERPIQKTGKHQPRPGNKSCKPSLNVENTESVKLAAPQSQPAPVSRAHLRVVQSKRVRKYG